MAFSLLLFGSLILASGVLPSLRWLQDEPIPTGRFVEWLLWQYPGYFVQALPIAVLLTILLVVGRLATTREFLAIMAAGVAPTRFAVPFLVLASAAVVGALLINQFVLPVAAPKISTNWWQLTEGNDGAWRLADREIPVGRYRLTFESVQGDVLRDVRVATWEGKQAEVWWAERAEYRGQRLRLADVQHYRFDFNALEAPDGSESSETGRLAEVIEHDQAAVLPLGKTLEQLTTQYGGGSYEDGRAFQELYRDARNRHLTFAERLQAKVLLHRKLAEPVANLVLVLLALPVALLYIRSRVVGFGLALAVALAWYLLLSLGLYLAQADVLPVWLGAWGGNLILGGFGLVLLLRLRAR